MTVIDTPIAECGHRIKMLREYRIDVDEAGMTLRVPLPARYRPVDANARWCGECRQFVDAHDDAEAKSHAISE